MTGATITSKGYIRLKAGVERDKYLHRVVADECLMESYGRHIREDEEVHHLCGNRSCRADFHLVIMPDLMHHAISISNAIKKKKKKRH